jgi:hypothetical protein
VVAFAEVCSVCIGFRRCNRHYRYCCLAAIGSSQHSRRHCHSRRCRHNSGRRCSRYLKTLVFSLPRFVAFRIGRHCPPSQSSISSFPNPLSINPSSYCLSCCPALSCSHIHCLEQPKLSHSVHQCGGIRWCAVNVHDRQDNRVGKASVRAKQTQHLTASII